MGKRGPKPVDLGMLNEREFEWYRAFHLLRDGTQLPHIPAFVSLTRFQTEIDLESWKKMTPRDIIALRQLVDPKAVDSVAETEEWAELQRERQISILEQQLKPKKIHALDVRRRIWRDLLRARNIQAVEEACRRWKTLDDVRAKNFAPLAARVSVNAREFLRIKGNLRFPRSNYADNSRLEYLARGMAGVMMGVSPFTAIERLRNMKHNIGGQLWCEAEERCKCWRCHMERSRHSWLGLAKTVIPGKDKYGV